MFAVLVDATPTAYQRFAEDYFEQALDSDAVREIFALRPLTGELVQRLNSDLAVDDLAEDVAEIGYPSRQA